MLDGRVVIVTGGGRGIGRCHCLELARHGATVVVNDLDVGVHGEPSAEAPAQQVATEITAAGGEALADGTSVTDWEATRAMVTRTVERFGALHAIVNNAGIVRDRMLTSMSEEDWDLVVAVHLKGTFNVTKHACDHWRSAAKERGALAAPRVVNTVSGTGLFGNVGQTSYGAAKAAIANLTMITAMEMDRYRVTCNAISPIAATRMTATVGARPRLQREWDPLDPANSSPVVAWLVSEASGWLSGAVLRVDGNAVQRVQPWTVDSNVQYRAKAGGTLDAEEMDSGLRRAFGLFPSGFASSVVRP